MAQAIPISFIIVFLMFSFLSISTANSNVYVQCSQLNFTSMSSYESNLNSLFTSLVDSASIYNFNKFETSPPADVVYGLFQCRGDLSAPNCKDCVASAVSQLKSTCQMSIGGQIQLEGCYVKYDNASFFGAQEKMEVFRRCGPSIGYNADVLNRINDALTYLVGGNGLYFRGGSFGSILGVAQCSQDLSLSDCQDYLSDASGRLRSECQTSTWGDMYLGKCYIRYADQGTENLANNGKSSSNKSEGSKNNIVKWIGYIIAASIGIGGLTFAVKNCCNIYVSNRIRSLQKDVEGAMEKAETASSEAKSATKKAERAVKKVEEESTKSESIYSESLTSTPSPYLYMPHSHRYARYFL